MNCPDCHCPRGEPLTVATNSLVTRCHNAFHAVAVSPACPDDFATQTAPDSPKPPPSHHGAAEAVLGYPYTTPIPTAHEGSTGWVYCNTCESPQPVSGHKCKADQHKAPWPYDWTRCDHSSIGKPGCPTCDPDKGRCLARKDYFIDALQADWDDLRAFTDATLARASFAESLLCAELFDHALITGGECLCPLCDAARRAARGGGR